MKKFDRVLAMRGLIREGAGVSSDDVLRFFLKNKSATAETVEEWAKETGYEPKVVLDIAFGELSRFAEFWLKGESRKSSFSKDKADQEELKKGIKVESEHTSDIGIATKIALDHLAETADYYTKLQKVEGSSEKEKPTERDED